MYAFVVFRRKTTVEVPDILYRQVKARAAMRGQSIKAFLLQAIRNKLSVDKTIGSKEQGWQAVFSKEAVSEVQRTINEEFSGIDLEDWQLYNRLSRPKTKPP